MLLRTTTALAAVLACLAAAPASAEDVAFEIINGTSVGLAEFYTSPVDTEAWEEDIAGGNTLAPGASVTVNITDGREQCDYDMKFVMEDGREHVANDINICEMASYTLTE